MRGGINVLVRLKTSRQVPPSISEIEFNGYRIRPIPSRTTSEKTQEALLDFVQPKMEILAPELSGLQSSSAINEALGLLAGLSVISRGKIEFDSATVNGSNVEEKVIYSQIFGDICNPSEIQKFYDLWASLRKNEQAYFLYSCRAYQAAMWLMNNNPTISFFLLVVAIESLANKILKKGKKSEKFVGFVFRHLPRESIGGDKTEISKTKDLLFQAYRTRCDFVHEGKAIPAATHLADLLDRKYVRHSVGKKELISPGLKWLEDIVRKALILFLQRRVEEKPHEPKKPFLYRIIEKESVIKLKAARSIKKGEPVKADDFHLD